MEILYTIPASTRVIEMGKVFGRNVGRLSDSATQQMGTARSPVFVDNGVHLAQIDIHSSDKPKLTKMKSETYIPTHPQPLSFVFTDDAIEVSQKLGGSRAKIVPYFSGTKLSDTNRPFFAQASSGPRLATAAIVQKSESARLRVKNSGGNASDVGFPEEDIIFTQPVDIGLRADDLAIKIGQQFPASNQSVRVRSLDRPNDHVRGRLKSTKFIAMNFRGVNALKALRTIGSYDNRYVSADKFGNIYILPLSISTKHKNIRLRSGQAITLDPIKDTINRIVVEGAQLAVNDRIIVEMDDRESQVYNGYETVREQVISDGNQQIIHEAQARSIGRSVLQAAKAGNSRLSLQGVPNTFDVDAGTIVTPADGNPLFVISSKYSAASTMSDFQFFSASIATDGSIESILNAISQSTDKGTLRADEPERVVDVSLSENMTIRAVMLVSTRNVQKDGLCIGGYGRGIIGGVGASASATITVSNTDVANIGEGDTIALIATDGNTVTLTMQGTGGSTTSSSTSGSSLTAKTLSSGSYANPVLHATAQAVEIRTAINHHTKFSATNSSNVVTVTQAVTGISGDTAITITELGATGFSKTDFTGGLDGKKLGGNKNPVNITRGEV